MSKTEGSSDKFMNISKNETEKFENNEATENITTTSI